MKIIVVAIAALALQFAATAATAQDQGSSEAAEARRLAAIAKSQHHLTGDVKVPGADVTLHLGNRYYFLGAGEARQVLKEWGNPPSEAEGVLGLVFPTGTTFLDDGWAGVITYEEAGYVSDEDADKADYQQLLDEARKGEDADNEQRKKDGFSSVHLVGWAQPPAYDKSRHYLIWARDIRFDGHGEDTLNYDVRVLGRRGYLSINVLARISQLPEIRSEAAQLASVATFDPGAAYADYQAGGDKKAQYGIAGLVAAGLGVAAAQKLGLLAVVAVFAKKLIFVFVAAFAALAAKLRSLFKKDPDSPA